MAPVKRTPLRRPSSAAPQSSRPYGMYALGILLGLGTVWVARAISATPRETVVLTASSTPNPTSTSEQTANPAPTLTEIPTATPTPKAATVAKTGDLQSQLDAYVATQSKIGIGIFTIDLNTGATASVKPEKKFFAASTAKLITALAFFQDVEAGRASLDQPMGPSSARAQMKSMINQSNNNSWTLFNEANTLPEQEKYAESIGLTDSNFTVTETTASDMALLLQKIWKREVANEEHTSLLLSFMVKTNEERLIAAYAPKGATVYHKYGWLDDYLHDVAIIKSGENIKILAVMTSGSGNYGTIAKVIDDITGIVTQ